MGPIETAVRKEVPKGSALSEIAYKLAFTLDEGDGSTAMVRELREILKELRPKRYVGEPPARLSVVPDVDGEELGPDLASDEVLEITRRDGGATMQTRRRARAGEVPGMYLNGVLIEK